MVMNRIPVMTADPTGSESTPDLDARSMQQLKTDDLALNSIMDRWSSRVASFVFKMTGSHALANELAQETFVKLYQARTRYEAKGSFSGYLFGIAANLVKNHRRWQMRHPTVSLDDPDFDTRENPAFIASHLGDPRGSIETSEALRTILGAMFSLPVDLREAITLFVDEGLSYREIAQVVGCTPKAVETRIYRARQILKIRLAGLDD
jgi:RNA polymerase sigma-70 factor (ECF subfamily)